MAKNLRGTHQIVTANRLSDGVVVFFTRSGDWSPDFNDAVVADDPAAAETLLPRARGAATATVEPYLVAVELVDGAPVPVSMRERIRVGGLTFPVLAAGASRYA
ncbi:MAG: DUF2849 domain-containing protein [Alphaproteobacteria bacterium]|nr:DUF2849 domain-containing protein [Alphaproteobacteria bacterium]